MIVSIDGSIVDAATASVSIFDRAFLYGDGVFTVLRTIGRKPIDLARHLARLHASAEALSIEARASAEHVHATLGEADARVRIILTHGGRSIVVTEPLPEQPTHLAMAIVDLPLARRSGAGHKTLAFADHFQAQRIAKARGADDAIRLGPDGDIAEGSTCNLFAVIDGVVVTPPLHNGILPGIVRGRVLELTTVVERSIAVDELHRATEVFATSSLRGVVPVTRIDTRELPIGPVATRVAAAYRDARDFYI